MALDSTEAIIEDVRRGRMVIIMDDEDRENEGDLIMAASLVEPSHINFMARHGRGLICLTLTPERCEQLKLPLMVRETYHSHATNFTVSIQAARGITSGISAADRALTVRTAVAPDARPSDLVQPGHVFPLMAQPGGVLTRAGHTEAGCDLARLAGLEPAAVIVEILNEDGTMARRPELERMAAEHGLRIGTIADLIRFRIQNERTIERVDECQLETEFGVFRLVGYRDTIQNELHLALVKGEISPEEPTLVRVHVENRLCDLTFSVRKDCGWPLRDALARVGTAESGVVVILCNQVKVSELERQLRSFKCPPSDAAEGRRNPNVDDLWTIGLGGQILADLGVRRMRVLSVPRRIHALSGFGLELVEYVS